MASGLCTLSLTCTYCSYGSNTCTFTCTHEHLRCSLFHVSASVVLWNLRCTTSTLFMCVVPQNLVRFASLFGWFPCLVFPHHCHLFGANLFHSLAYNVHVRVYNVVAALALCVRMPTRLIPDQIHVHACNTGCIHVQAHIHVHVHVVVVAVDTTILVITPLYSPCS